MWYKLASIYWCREINKKIMFTTNERNQCMQEKKVYSLIAELYGDQLNADKEGTISENTVEDQTIRKSLLLQVYFSQTDWPRVNKYAWWPESTGTQ